MNSTYRFGCCEDGHGTDEFFSWANLLPVGIWSRQRECQCFLMRSQAKEVVSDVGRRAGGWMRGFWRRGRGPERIDSRQWKITRSSILQSIWSYIILDTNRYVEKCFRYFVDSYSTIVFWEFIILSLIHI